VLSFCSVARGKSAATNKSSWRARGDPRLARWRERLFDDLSGAGTRPELRVASAR